MFMLDAKATVTYVNTAFLKLLAVNKNDDVVGHALSNETFWYTQEDRQRLCELLQRGERDLLELRLKTNDGECKRILLLLTAAKNACDEIRSWQGVLWNVSERRPSGCWDSEGQSPSE